MERSGTGTLGSYRVLNAPSTAARTFSRLSESQPTVEWDGDAGAPGPLGLAVERVSQAPFVDATLLCEELLSDDLGGRALLEHAVGEGRMAAQRIADDRFKAAKSFEFSFEGSELQVGGEGDCLPGPTSDVWRGRVRVHGVRLSGRVQGQRSADLVSYTMHLGINLTGDVAARHAGHWSPLEARIEREVTWGVRSGVTVSSSVRVRRLAAAFAAALLLVVAGLWWQMGFPEATGDRLTGAAVYAMEQRNGFVPAFVCENDAQFAAVTAEKLGVALVPRATAGLALVGWTYRPVLGGYSMVLLARVDETPVLVVMDRIDKDRRPDPGTDGLRVFRREIEGAVMYEITPLDSSRVLDTLGPAR